MEYTDSDLIRLTVKDQKGDVQEIEIPDDDAYNLMEMLRACDFKIRATCGGMGLCADCHCRVTEGFDQLPEHTAQELDTLEILPNATPLSRLTCQLRPGPYLNNISLELLGPVE